MTPQGWNAGKLLATSGAYWQSCTLHAAVRLGLFNTLAEEALSSSTIAKHQGTNERATKILLDALVAMELLEKKPGGYSNTVFTQTYLTEKSPQYLGYMILHHHNLVASWSELPAAVSTGRPTRNRSSFSDQDTRQSFLLGMFNQAMQVAPRLSTQIDLSGRHHLLDLGGGPGTYAIHFCLQQPDLRATVYDLPGTRPFAEQTMARFNLQDRITFQSGDYLKEEIQGHYDVVWLSHIVHAEGPGECQALINKAVAALDAGGLILIHDFYLNDTMDGPLFPALFSLNMLLGTSKGQSYSEHQVRTMLAQAGLHDIKRIPVDSPNGAGVICGLRGKDGPE